jgi:hypothetical protein
MQSKQYQDGGQKNTLVQARGPPEDAQGSQSYATHRAPQHPDCPEGSQIMRLYLEDVQGNDLPCMPWSDLGHPRITQDTQRAKAIFLM